MVSLSAVEKQLKQVGCNFKFWGRPEIRELSHILMPDEIIAQCVNGQYEGGLALLVATDRRVLLIDKKPLYLTIDDMRFDMISDVYYSHRLLDATLRIASGNKTLVFTTVGRARLRTILNHVQKRVTEVRNQHDQAEQAEKKIANEVEQVERVEQQSVVPAPPPVTAVPPAPAILGQPSNFNGFGRQVALQIAHHIGPRAVAFSQLPPTFTYKVPFSSRRWRQPQAQSTAI